MFQFASRARQFFGWLNSDLPAGSWKLKLKDVLKRTAVTYVMFLALLAVLLLGSGCQFDLEASSSSKFFHKNNNGQSDPRTGMYDGSGYHERVNGGDVKPSSGFRTIGDSK